jgi:L-lactate dehydrogenase complex protein LldG
MSAAREAILARIRAATSDVDPGEPLRWEGPGPPGSPDAYRRRGSLTPGAGRVALFADRVSDYRADVIHCAGEGIAIAAAVAAACARHDALRMLVPSGIPPAWLPTTVTWTAETPHEPLPLTTLDSADGVLTAAAAAIAETGTIILDHRDDRGRRALSLVPDLHLCVVRADQIVDTVPEAFDRLRDSVLAGWPITFISGPSATSDIELQRVEGVHGPRRLVVLLVG